MREDKSIGEIIAMIPPALDAAGKLIDRVGPIYGSVHKCTTAVINGKKGFLVWDSIVWNEITFQDEDGKIMPFFTSMSDKETEKEWNDLVKKYGV